MQSLDVGLSDIEREQAWEEKCLNDGIEQYREITKKHAELGRECFTDYGQKLLRQHIDRLAEAIMKFIEEAEHKPGQRAGAARHLKLVPKEVAAFIAAQNI